VYIMIRTKRKINKQRGSRSMVEAVLKNVEVQVTKVEKVKQV
jgi:hypothetical protein